MLRLVNTQRVYPPDVIAAMTAAFDELAEVLPKSVDRDVMGRQLALIILRHVDRGVRDPEGLSEAAFREFAGLDHSAQPQREFAP